MSNEKPWELRDRLAVEILEDIRADRRRVSVRVARLLAKIEERLFDHDLQIQDLRRDKNLSTRFAEELGLGPWKYLTQCRMKLAGLMLTAGDHKVWQIAVEVGYPSGKSLSRVFTKWCGKSPTDFRDEARAEAAGAQPLPPPADLLSREELLRAVDGDLPPAQAAALLRRLGELQNTIRGHYHAPVPPVPQAEWVEPAMAQRLWQWIEVLPPEAQMAAVASQAGVFHTPALFHRLCTESIEAGLEDDVSGMQIASLALVAMTSIVERLGKQPASLNLFARAHAVAGHAFRRSGYPADAGQSFGVATRMLGLAGDEAHPVVMMELCLYQAMLHLDRDEQDSAAMLIDIGVKIYEALMTRLKRQGEERQGEEDRGTEGGDTLDGGAEGAGAAGRRSRRTVRQHRRRSQEGRPTGSEGER